jgi:hypothetical protein
MSPAWQIFYEFKLSLQIESRHDEITVAFDRQQNM